MSTSSSRAPLQDFVQRIRQRHGGKQTVPGFDPANGNLAAKYLLVLEAPGPTALATGMVSLTNPDPTARNLKSQLAIAGVPPQDIAIWNVVPWFVSDSTRGTIRPVRRSEAATGTAYLLELVSMMAQLKCIVLVGRAAAQAHVPLSAHVGARILACHHPSQRSLNSRATATQDNIDVFKRMQC